jgi:glycerol-3-phosphate dehydrogenase subunit B
VALSTDVLVIGGGMAGAAAALTARASGARVVLAARAPGATALSSGAVDIAADGDLPIREAARKLAGRPGHPYALVGDLDAAVDDALKFLRGLGFSGSGERNLWLLSQLGCPKPAALAQAPIAAGDLRALPRNARPMVVALCGSQAIEARLQAEGLARLFPGARALPVEFYVQRGDALRTLPEIAADLDRPGRRAALAEALQRAARSSGATHLFLPTVGFEPAQLSCGVPVFELLSAPPSVPGLRLQRTLEFALRKAGIDVRAAIAEKRVDGGVQLVSGTSCEAVDAAAIVLATGRFIGGGIRGEPALRETVLDLPAWAGERRSLPALPTEELFAQKAGGRHPGLAAGLRPGPGLRALDAQGAPATAAGSPVFAAGAVIGGYDPSRDEGGLGAAALLGLAAGRSAAAVALAHRERASA